MALGLLFKDFFEAAFAAPVLAGGLLILTALLLVMAERFGSRVRELESLGWLDAIIIGFWQAASMLPGISRSGSTIGGAVLRGFNRPAAAISGYICIRWLLHYLQRHSLYIFAAYCAALSIISIMVAVIRG